MSAGDSLGCDPHCDVKGWSGRRAPDVDTSCSFRVEMFRFSNYSKDAYCLRWMLEITKILRLCDSVKRSGALASCYPDNKVHDDIQILLPSSQDLLPVDLSASQPMTLRSVCMHSELDVGLELDVGQELDVEWKQDRWQAGAKCRAGARRMAGRSPLLSRNSVDSGQELGGCRARIGSMAGRSWIDGRS